jgi:dTDP-4-amino-4,6-dideoxygalactose transaminase
MKIPFHIPFYDAADEEALVSSLRTHQLVGDGPRTVEASRQLATMLGVRHVLLTTSCTHALELAMMVLRLKAGDEVIVPSFTFVSTTNCILRQGAHIVFADIAPETLTLNGQEFERRITARTKAIIPVVYAGISPDIDAMLSVARARGIVVIEDAAQAVGATYRGRPAGTTGDIGCYSFHETKNYSTGEGGAFVTNNADYASLAEIIREKGTNRKQFLQGLIDKYTWVDVGSSYLPPDHTAALLLSQLGKMDFIQRRREEIHRQYVEAFTDLAQEGLLTLPTIPEFVRSNYHIFYVLMSDETTRNSAIAFFRSKNIGTTFHYLPLHLSPVGQRLGYRAGDFPVTESVCGRLLRLPIYPSLTTEQQDKIIHTMREFFRQ